MSSINADDPISSSLFPKSRRVVLGLLYSHPDRLFYLREIVMLTGLGVGHVQRELKRLTQGGVIRRTKQGRHVYFQADEQCPIYQELRGLVIKTAGAVGILRHALEPLASRITAAFVFGSVARGEERRVSDLDLMVIGAVGFAEVVEAIRSAESRILREINPSVYPVDEFSNKLSAGHHFLETVMNGNKVFVLGNEHELGKLLEQRMDPQARADGG